MKKMMLLAAAAAVLFTGCVTDAERRASVRVGTYNIRLATGDKGTPNAWELRRDALVAQIRKMSLDAFGLQEGRLGRLTFARVDVPWWREDAYYTESSWHGTWKMDGGAPYPVDAAAARRSVDLVERICNTKHKEDEYVAS